MLGERGVVVTTKREQKGELCSDEVGVRLFVMTVTQICTCDKMT